MRYVRYINMLLLLQLFFNVMVDAFFEHQFQFEIVEGAPTGTLIGKITVNDGLNYRLNGRSELVNFNPTNGEIRSAMVFDRESISVNGSFNIILVAQPAAIISVHVTVLDINDNDPVFPSSFMNVSIVESAAIGSRVALHSATDADFGDNGTIVSYSIEDSQSVFMLVRSTSHSGDDVLLLELTESLDREQKDLYVVNVSASDGGNPPRFGYSTVLVNVLDANDNAPVFEQSHYEASVTAHPGQRAAIITVEASDADVGENARILYRLSNDPHKQFEIDEHNGTIFAKKEKLNCSRSGCEQNCSRICVISVEAEDQGSPKLVGHAFVNIHLSDSNDYDPLIHFRMYPVGVGFASVSEDAIIGTTIAVVTVTDDDYAQNSQIEIIDGNDDEFFRLENGNNFAVVRLNRLLNGRIKPFQLTIRATDDGFPQRYSQRDLEIFVLRIDDKAPLLDSGTIEAHIFDDSAFGSLVTVVHASSDVPLLFSIIEDSSNGSFKIGRHSGIITVAKPLDGRKMRSAALHVEVKNDMHSIKTSMCKVIVSVETANNNAPVFEKDLYVIETAENTPLLSVITKVSAHDEDDGSNGLISYSIIDNSSRRTFAIKEKTGEIVLRRVLDREYQHRYVLTIRASDNGYPRRSSTTQVIVNVLDINDNRPHFLQDEYFCFLRKYEPPGSEIIRIEAKDSDAGRYGHINYLLYQSPMGLFELDYASGILRLASHIDERLVETEFRVLIGAKDGGGLLSTSNASVIVQIVDNNTNVPKFALREWNVTIKENSPAGTSIGAFAIENSDGRDVRYRLSNSTFLTIHESSGEISLRQSLDREQVATVSFTVFASDDRLTAQHSGLLTVLDTNDNSPEFELGQSVHLTVTSSTTIGSELIRLLAADADEEINSVITYSVNNEYFDVDRETGILRYQKRIEHTDQIQFTVMAHDGGNPSLSGSIRVTVNVENDEPVYDFPAQIALTVSEDAYPGTLIASLAPSNGTRRYEFWANVPSGDDYPVWILTSGEVFVVSTLDRERRSVFKIPVSILTSVGSYTSQQSLLLTVYVDDVNDNAPECPQKSTFSIMENEPPHSIVGVLDSVDRDAGLNGTVFFELKERNENFTVDADFGVIRTTAWLDRELCATYNLTVIIKDGGGRLAECNITIEVEDVNDNAPIMKAEFYHFEAFLTKHSIGFVSAIDRDQGVNAEITYSLVRRTTHIKVDAASGELSHDGEIEAGKVYNLTIVATDQGQPQLSTSALVFVYVIELRKCTPRFIVYPTKTIELNESIRLGTLIATVTASACDEPLIYSITDGNRDSTFWIDGKDGTVIVVRPLDFERQRTYRLALNAATASGNTSILLQVDVRDVNDNEPQIETSLLHVKENDEPGSVCAKITVTDADSGDNGRVHLEILNQFPMGNEFRLDGSKLICEDVLDREHSSNYRLLLRATDYGNPAKSAQKMVMVIVDDENDNAPKCRGADTFLIGNKALNIRLDCFDADEGLNGSIGYEILTMNRGIDRIRDDFIRVEPFQGEMQHFSVRIFDRYVNETIMGDPLQKSIERHFTLIPYNPSAYVNFNDPAVESIRVFSNVSLGTVVGRVNASAVSTIEYYLTAFRSDHSDVVRWIDVDRNSGQLRIIRKPVDTDVDVEITAVSKGFTASKMIKIQVEGLNDVYEGIRAPFYEFEIMENVPPGFMVGSIAVDEKDDYMFRMVSVEWDNLFEIGTSDGIILSKAEIDYEQVHDVVLSIIASKPGLGSQVQRAIVVYIRIIDVNDNRPQFANDSIWLMVKENSVPGTFIGQVLASDSDSGTYGSIEYSLIDAPSVVHISRQLGIITVTGIIDREKESAYKFKVRATDGGGLSSDADVFVVISDENDNLPRFEFDSYAIDVREDTDIGVKLLQMNVFDNDSDCDFLFEIERRGNERGLFAIDRDGVVSLAAPLDRESSAKHVLRITVTDQRPPHKVFSASTTLTVNVIDVNDNAPTFISSNTFFVFEEVPLGTLVGIVVAIDADFGNNAQVQYRIIPVSHPEALFIVDPILGYIQVNGRVDREKKAIHHLTIEASDGGSPIRTSSTNITIVVLDIDDNESILKDMHYGKVVENTAIGHDVVRIVFEDSDELESSAKIFEIEDGDPEHCFHILPRSGVLVVDKVLDAEFQSDYNLSISMRSSIDSMKQFTRVYLEVIDINDERPRFKGGDHLVFTIAENHHGPYPIALGSTIAEDRDQNDNGTISYAIVQGDTSLFAIDSQSGQMFVKAALDYEECAEYNLKVQAIDMGTPRLSATVHITVIVEDINDNDPIFELPYYRASIRENLRADEIVFQLKATDMDAGENAKLRYSLAEEEKIPFRIDPVHGIVYTTAPLDREAASLWYLKVTAHDGGQFIQRSTTVSMLVTVFDDNDNPPTILNSVFDVYTPERIIKGDIVHAVRAYDMDEDERLIYTVAGPDKSFFNIDEDGAVIARTDIYKKDCVIIVTVTDKGGKNASITLNFYSSRIQNFPVFEQSLRREFTVKEGEAEKLITTFAASSSNISSYGIQYGIAGGDPFSDFSINPHTGQLFTRGTIDYERRRRYRLLISATDQHNHPLVAFTSIVVNVEDVNDNRPIFDQILYEAEISENADSETLLLNVYAVDKDASVNGDVRYSILEEDMRALFRISENSGEIFTIVPLDADIISKRRFTVKAEDRGQPSLSQIAIVKVRILDENDNSPKFSHLFRAEIEENSAIGAFVTQISSTDVDMSSVVTYELEDDGIGIFRIDPYSGIVTLISHIDRETQSEYALNVRAMDGVWQVRTSLTITILDQNDNAPIFTRDHFKFFVVNNAAVDSIVGRIEARDADSGDNGVVFYSLRCAQDRFTVDPSSGLISLSIPLGNYTNEVFMCEAEAIDGGMPALAAMATVEIIIVGNKIVVPRFADRRPYFALLAGSPNGTVIGQLKTEPPTYYMRVLVYDDRFAIDENGTLSTRSKFPTSEIGRSITLRLVASFEQFYASNDEINATIEVTGANLHPPKFAQKKVTFSVPENSEMFTIVGIVSAFDDDPGINGRIIYAVDGNDFDQFPFDVNATTGVVFVVGPVDYERKKIYKFFIVASDCGVLPQKATAQVLISVVDQNDNVPQFEEDSITLHVMENTAIGTIVAKILATDADSGDFGIIVYGIEAHDESHLPFSVNSTSGQIIISSFIDYELKKNYHFDLTARNPDDPRCSRLRVEVLVDSQNEFNPKFLTTKQHFEVSAKAIKGTIIGKVSAIDLDEGRHGRVVYSMPANNITEINAHNGEIFLKRTLNGSSEGTVLEILAMNPHITRFDQEMPHLCRVELVASMLLPTPVLLPRYVFNISEGAPLSTSFQLTSPPELPSGVHLEISSEDSDQAFCRDQGIASLRLCGPLDRENVAKYEFEVALMRGETRLSYSMVAINVMDLNDNAPQINVDAAVGFIRENSPPSTLITRLRPTDEDVSDTGTTFAYRIVDAHLGKVFSVDESTGLLIAAMTLDREARSQYVIPIAISDLGRPPRSATYNVRIYVDDARDNLAETGSRNLYVENLANNGDNSAAFTIGRVHIAPRIYDETAYGDLICKENNVDDVILKVSSNCEVQLGREIPSEVILSVDAYDRHFLSNVTFSLVLKQRSIDATLFNSSISLDVWAMPAAIADMVDLLQEGVPDMAVRLIGVERLGLDSYRILVSVSDRNGAIVAADEAIRMVKHFYNKRNASINVYIRAVMSDVCASSDGCLNGGICEQTTLATGQFEQFDGYKSSFVIPIVKRHARCTCKPLTSGERCEVRAEMCSTKKPCANGGTCDSTSGQCSCPAAFRGMHCEEDVNECAQKNVCGDGECVNMPGSFKCICNVGFTGARCERRLDFCDSVLCISGKCVHEGDRGRCLCNSGYHGRSCELRSRGFRAGSYMEVHLPPFPKDISLEFKTTLSSALLLYSYSRGTLSDFDVVDIVRGRVRFASRVADLDFVNVILNTTVNDSTWKRIRLEQKWQTVRLTVETCDDSGYCHPCENTDCSKLAIKQTSQLWSASDFVFVGGINNITDIGKRPNQVSSIDFTGCLRRFEVDGVSIDRLEVVSEAGVTTGCSSEGRSCHDDGMIAECMDGACMRDEAGSAKCICADGFDSASCRSTMEEWTLNGGEIRFTLTPYVRRQISFVPVDAADALVSKDATRHRRAALRDIPCEEIDYTEGDQLDGVVTQWVELDFRTMDAYGTLFTIAEESRSSHVKIENGSLRFITFVAGANPMVVHLDVTVSDGKWHRLGLQIGANQKTIRFQLDGHGKEIHSMEQFPSMISSSLSYISLGVVNKEESLTGCVRRFILNNQAQSFDIKSAYPLHEQLLAVSNARFVSPGCGTRSIFSSASLEWNSFWTIVGVLLAVTAFLMASLAAWMFWRRYSHICVQRRKGQGQQRSNLRLFSVSADSIRGDQKHSDHVLNDRHIPSPWLYASMPAMQTLQQLYNAEQLSRQASSGLGSSGNTPSDDGYQNIERITRAQQVSYRYISRVLQGGGRSCMPVHCKPSKISLK
uniref:Protocadherin-16 n=1 Tax=Ascaris suum TaxID=6253 RepID=F1KPG5_ASCSU